MESTKIEATILEELVCASKEKELRVHCHAVSGRGWVEVGNRKFISKSYVQAAKHLHAQDRLEVKHQDQHRTVYGLGHHVCTKVSGR